MHTLKNMVMSDRGDKSDSEQKHMDSSSEDFDVDLTEFATALRTFPETILKAVLGIYHKREAIKKQQDKGYVHNTLNLTKTEDRFQENSLIH